MSDTNYRLAFYALMIVLLPEVAMANMIIPMLAVQWPIMVVMLGGVIMVEVLVLRKLWPAISLKIITKGTIIGNVISTLAGIPLAHYLHYKFIYEPIALFSLAMKDLPDLNLPYPVTYILHMTINAPVAVSLVDLHETYVKFMFLMPIAYVVSYYIEFLCFDINIIGENKLLPGIRTANRYSYLFVFAVTSILFLIMACIKNSKLFTIWSYILNRTMWLAVWYPY